MKRKIIILFSLLGLIVYAYWGLWLTFFQQDEWLSLGLVIANGVWGEIGAFTPVEILSGRGRVLGSLLNNIFDLAWPYTIPIFAWFAIILHSVNSFLVYSLLVKLTKHSMASFAGAVFFTLNTTASQSITWISSHASVLPNAFFVLSGFYTFLLYREKRKLGYLYLSFVVFILSYYFKESSLFLILLLPITEYLLSVKSPPLRLLCVRYSPIIIFLLLISVIRLSGLYTVEAAAGVLISNEGHPITQLLLHMFFYPVVGLFHLFVPSQILFRVAETMLYTNDMHATIAVSDVLAFGGSVLGLILLGYIWVRIKSFRMLIIFSLLFIFLSMLPFIVLDRPQSAYLESRYYYLGAIGASFLFALLYQLLATQIGKHQGKTTRLVFMVVLAAVVTAYLYKQSVFIRREVRRLVIVGQERQAFLQTLDSVKGTLPDRPIFYIEGDSPGMYGIADLAVPFQQGLGYTIMVWFFDTGKIPEEFLRSSFLWNINAQGYQVVGGEGFGYFWDKERLRSEFVNNPNLSPEQIVAFRYIASDQKLIDRTSETRKLFEKGGR